MNRNRYLLGLCLAAMLAAASPARADDADIFVPTSGWLVGPALMVKPAGMENAALPCVMADQYSNGYGFRFSGGDGKILAMAIDFRQKVFEPGNNYDLSVGIPSAGFDEAVKGQAYDEATLIINFQKSDAFYVALTKGKILTLKIGGKSMDFALLGQKDGLSRMEGCYRPGGGAPPRDAQAEPSADPQSMQMRSAHFSAMPDEKAPKGVTAQPDATLPGSALPAPDQRSQNDNDDKGMANALDARLQAVANELSPAAKAAPISREPKGVPLAGSWTQPPPQKQNIAQNQNPAAQSGDSALMRQWRGQKGIGLRELLEGWAADSQGRVVWRARTDFPLKDAVSVNGSFETAVLGVLQSYAGDAVRPVGRIYIDPATGQKVLLVDDQNGG
jgi:hypothetical protein